MQISCDIKPKKLEGINENIFEIDNSELMLKEYIDLMKDVLQDISQIKIISISDYRGIVKGDIPKKYKFYMDKLVKVGTLKDIKEIEEVLTMSALRLITLWFETNLGTIYTYDIEIGFIFESNMDYMIDKNLNKTSDFFEVSIDEE